MSSLNDYTVISLLGRGSFGQVKRKSYTVAVHNGTNTQVALKFLNKSRVNRESFSRIKTEIEILKKLAHPSIMALYDVINSAESLVLVTEYLPGGELYNLIQEKGSLTECQAKSIFKQVLLALEFCHLNSVVHRDLKPENILFDASGNAKLADFGLGTLLTGEFLLTPCGSQNYASPEIISGAKYSGTEIDVWSAGVVLYAMVAGTLPFGDESTPVLYSKIKTGNFSMPFGFSTALKDLIERMLNTHPVARITASEALKHPWLECSAAELRSVCFRNKTKVNEAVLRKALALTRGAGISLEEAREIVVTKKFEGITVAYRLLESKEIKSEKDCSEPED